jgi:hypothetical protein
MRTEISPDNPAPATTEQHLSLQSVGDDATDPEGTIEEGSIEDRRSCTLRSCRACALAGGDCENAGTLGWLIGGDVDAATLS